MRCKEVDRAALAVAREPEQIVELLRYVLDGHLPRLSWRCAALRVGRQPHRDPERVGRDRRVALLAQRVAGLGDLAVTRSRSAASPKPDREVAQAARARGRRAGRRRLPTC